MIVNDDRKKIDFDKRQIDLITQSLVQYSKYDKDCLISLGS